MIRRFAPSFVALALLGAACGQPDISVTAVEPPEGGFFTQVVDFTGDAGHGLWLATDADGNPHLSYLSLSTEEPAAEAGPTPTPVPGPTGTPGATPSPAAGLPGQPPILPAVMHVHLVQNQLTRSPVAQGRAGLTADDQTAIAVDAEGIHHVVWTEGGSTLWYANNVEGDFGEPEQIPVIGDDVSGLSAAAAEDGTFYAAFTEGTGVEGPGAIVRLVIRSPQGEGSVETVAEAGLPGPTGVGAGAQGVFVAYGDEGATLVATDDGDAWASQTADEDGGYGIGLALDGDGNPHVAYANGAGDVKHAHSIDGGAWEVSIVGSAGLSPGEHEFQAGIAVDEEGVHHVAWTDATGISYSNNAEGPFGRPEQIPGTETKPAAETPRVANGLEGPFIAWYDPENTEVQLTHRAEDAPPLALPSPSPQTGGQTDGGPTTPCEPEGTELSIVAENLQFDTDCLAAPVGEAFTIDFDNRDAQPHNVAIYTDPSAAEEIFREEAFPGPATETYEVDPVEEPGQFYFQCDVHPTMNGTFVVDGGAGKDGGNADGNGGGKGGGGGNS